MKKEEKVGVKLPSGMNVELSESVFEKYYRDFDDVKYVTFNNHLNSGLYFPQILQFIFVLIYICKGHTNFKDILLCNLIMGAGYTAMWYMLKLYKVPFLSFISCLIGGNIFRFFLHYIVIIAVALFVVKDWKVILFCVIGGLITTIVKSILMNFFSNVKYNDEVAKYVSKFKNK